MAITNTGGILVATCLMNDTPTFIDNTNAYIGVGTSNTAFNATQTDLLGTSDRQAMEATYPLRSTNVLTFRSVWGTSQGNFAWEEWGVFNASTAGTMVNRVVESLGTKTSAQSWQFTVTNTVVAS